LVKLQGQINLWAQNVA